MSPGVSSNFLQIDAKTMEKKTLTESIEGLAKEISELEASAADAAAEREKHVAGHTKAVQEKGVEGGGGWVRL
ncbi:unnamed protein product [Effrenium voratum]|uniref:Uncharacterized protein n=1 Tax=Effrenium voratum TaxID=2562239 RepID=A0AA36NA86_9DINO|nr:unnamed protein product [Effrenium voratum]